MRNPYTPGIGGFPPVFAGRDEELREIDDLTDGLATGQSVPRETILYGPRGNGKTTLLHHVERKLEKNSRVYPVFVHSPSVPTPPQSLHQKLLRETDPSQLTETSQDSQKRKTSLLTAS